MTSMNWSSAWSASGVVLSKSSSTQLTSGANVSVCVVIGVARILFGGALFWQKSWRPFLVVALTDRLNIPPNISHSANIVLKIDSYSGWGVHFVSWEGARKHFSCKLGLKKNFHRPGGVQVHPLHPLATPMFLCIRVKVGHFQHLFQLHIMHMLLAYHNLVNI